MKPDSMLTTDAMIAEGRAQVRKAFRETWKAFARSEPELADFIQHEILEICGKMALAGVGTAAVRGASADFNRLVLTAILAIRRGHYELWKDTVSGTRLADLWQSVQNPSEKPAPDSQPRDRDWGDCGR